MRSGALLLLAMGLGGCAVAPSAPVHDQFFADHLFRAPRERVDASRVFAVSEAMKRYLAEELGERPGSKGRQHLLADALRNETALKLEYDSDFTRNAAEAFEARAGNCLSLAIMTAALARQIGVGVRFQNVFVDENWSRKGDLYFSAGHVNLVLGARPPKLGTRLDDGEQLTIDFLPPTDLRGTYRREIGEKTIVAMYMNNRAAESLVTGNVDDAYWFAREAIRHDPGFMAAYNALGVVYRRRGHLAEAERALSFALATETRNVSVISNLVPVLADLGRLEESRALERKLAQLEPEPPFSFFFRGKAAMLRGDYRAARELFEKEVARAPYNHEFHFWLALALANLGQRQPAEHHLALAAQTSTTNEDRALYAAKLARIKSLRPD